MRCPLKSPATQWCQAMGLVLQVVEKRESTLVLLMSHPRVVTRSAGVKIP